MSAATCKRRRKQMALDPKARRNWANRNTVRAVGKAPEKKGAKK